MLYKKPPLTKSQVDEIKRLCLDENMGAKRIAVLTGVDHDTISKIIKGRTYRQWTGGKLLNGRRKEALWRHGSKSYYDIVMDEV